MFAGLHSVFYELWKDIKRADTSIQWCQLSVAVIELLHLSQGRGEVWPQATGDSSENSLHTSHYVLRNGRAGLTEVIERSHWILIVSPLISPHTVLMGYNWISNALAQVVKAIACKLTCVIDYQWKEELHFWPTWSVCVDVLGRLNYVDGMRFHIRFFQNVT